MKGFVGGAISGQGIENVLISHPALEADEFLVWSLGFSRVWGSG